MWRCVRDTERKPTLSEVTTTRGTLGLDAFVRRKGRYERVFRGASLTPPPPPKSVNVCMLSVRALHGEIIIRNMVVRAFTFFFLLPTDVCAVLAQHYC